MNKAIRILILLAIVAGMITLSYSVINHNHDLTLQSVACLIWMGATWIFFWRAERAEKERDYYAKLTDQKISQEIINPEISEKTLSKTGGEKPSDYLGHGKALNNAK